MDSVGINDYTYLQLRAWLRKLGVATTGAKSALVTRLNKIPVDQRGECPNAVDDDDDDAENAVGGDAGKMIEPVQGDNERKENDSNEKTSDDNECLQIATIWNKGEEHKQSEEKDRVTKKQIIPTNESNNECNQSEDKDRAVKENEAEQNERELRLKEREMILLRRENELLVKELKMLKMSAEMSNTEKSTGTLVTVGDLKCSFEDVLPEYDGGVWFEIWAEQLKNVAEVYQLDSNMLRSLMIKKMKGKAQQWLFSKPNFLTESVDKLIEEMRELFGTKEDKVTLRRKFEARQWQHNENFAQFYNDKLILANLAQVADDEIVTYLVEGITDEHLRTQAKIQCFKTKSDMLKAFADITLKKHSSANMMLERKADMRCYNCNSLGHFADECKKPKREYGACYACGSKLHRVAVCPLRKNSNA